MAIHELKTDPAFYHACYMNDLSFQLRKNDRGYEVGDLIVLRETMYTGEEMQQQGKPLKYTGLYMAYLITYVLCGPRLGLASDWCILSITPMSDYRPTYRHLPHRQHSLF